MPTRPDLTRAQVELVTEACTRSSISWIRLLDEDQRHLAWHVWHDGAVHVVYGVGEQMMPMLHGHVEVVVPSKENRSALVVFIGRARVLGSDTDAWRDAVAALGTARLNSPDLDGREQRWAGGCMVSRIEPIHVLAAGAGRHDEPSGARVPPGNPGTTTTRRPWHLGGRR